jgi:hypothetical protein
MNRLRGLGCISAIVLIVMACWFYWRAELKPSRDLERLLSGDNGIEISSIRISGQGITIEMRDEATAEYLTRAFRGAINEGHVPNRIGRPYEAWLEFGNGHSVRVALNSQDDIEGWTIVFPIGTIYAANYYWVSLPVPMPNELANAIRRMKQ